MNNKYYPYLYNRSAPPPVPPGPIPPPSPPHKPPKKKFNFKEFKNDTCTSLNDVEYFLNNFTSSLKYIKLIKLLK